MEEKEYVLVLDSGVGGMKLFSDCVRLMPNENFIFIADNKTAPYGNRTKKQLEKGVLNAIKKVKKNYKLKLIVFACNTATAATIDYIKAKMTVEVLGIEPAIKLAQKKGGNILLLSTCATLKHSKSLQVLKKGKPKNVFFSPMKNLEGEIDKHLDNLDNVAPYINKVFKKYKNKKIDSVVLGCTHFNFIKPYLKVALNNSKLKFFESSNAVAKKAKKMLSVKTNVEKEEDEKGEVIIMTTKSDTELETQLKEYIK